MGEHFEGLHLTHVSVDRAGVGFMYRTCALEVPADGGCAPPLQIQVRPRCVKLDAVESGLRIRGAPLNYSYAGDPMLYTNRVEVTVSTGEGSTRGMKLRALRALRSVNDVPPFLDAEDPIPAPRRKQQC